MPSVTTRKTRQRSQTPTRQKIAEPSEGLTPGWASGHPDLFKEPVFISPLKTRPSTRRQSMFIRATAEQKTVASGKKTVSTKKPKPNSSAMTGTRQPSAPRETVSNRKRAAVRSPPPSESTSATKKVTRARSRTPSRVKDVRSRSPQKESGSSKIPVKSRERTPSRGRRTTPSRSTRSRSRSRTRAGTPLKRSSSAARKTPSSNKRAVRKETPSRETPSRSTREKQAVKRPASPARAATPLKAAKVLGKSQLASPTEATAVSTPQTSTPSRLGRKRTTDIPVSEIRHSKRLAARGVTNTSMDVTLDSAPATEEPVANGNGWGSWCTIL